MHGVIEARITDQAVKLYQHSNRVANHVRDPGSIAQDAAGHMPCSPTLCGVTPTRMLPGPAVGLS